MSGIEVHRDGSVATVTLTRPERRNALDVALFEELREAFAVLGADGDVRVVVVRGAGAAFCAGADLEWMRASRELSEDDNVVDATRMASAFEAIDACPKAVVVAVHGAAIGGGAGIVACADTAIAAEGTRFAFSEVRLGLLPATISPYVLRRIGPGAARHRFTTGEPFDADDARRIGLVDLVVPAADLDRAIADATEAYLRAGPHAVAACKRLIRDATAAYALDDLAQRIAAIRVSAEGRAGVSAFLERRDPPWSPAS